MSWLKEPTGKKYLTTGVSRRLTLCIVLLMLCSSFATEKKPFRANLLITSAGSWMVFSKTDSQRKPYPYSFNKLTQTLYFQLFSLSGMAKVPLALTVPNTKPRNDADTLRTKPRLWFSDFDFYVGKRFGWIVPKIGLEFPLGYAIDDDWKRKAWIGSNNLRLQGGFSISRTHFETIGLPFGLDAMLSVSLTEKNARYKRGALAGQLYLKTSHNFSKKLNAGVELAVYGKSGIPEWSPERENGVTLLPALFGSYRTGKKFYIGAKFGYGPSLGLNEGSEETEHRSNSMDCGVSLQYYP